MWVSLVPPQLNNFLTNNNLGGYMNLYDIVYIIETSLAIALYVYLIRIAHLFIVEKRWTKWQ